MSSMSLKEFSKLLIEYVNCSLLPLLRIGESEHERAIQRWNSLARSLDDIDRLDLWSIENLFKKGDLGFKKEEDYHKYLMTNVFYNQKQKIDESQKAFKNSAFERMSYYAQTESQRSNRQLNDSKFTQLLPPTRNTHSNLFNVSLLDQQSAENEGMDKLITSFKKLVHIVTLNHTNMLNQQNQLENNKDTFSVS